MMMDAARPFAVAEQRLHFVNHNDNPRQTLVRVDLAVVGGDVRLPRLFEQGQPVGDDAPRFAQAWHQVFFEFDKIP